MVKTQSGFILGLFLVSLQALAHSGGQDSNGGHTNSSTGEYHCHSATCVMPTTAAPTPTPSPAPTAISSTSATCNGHLKYGLPSEPDQLLCRQGYALGYNYSRKSADWVAYRLTPGIHNSGNVPRQDDFREDTEIPAIYRTTPDDYDEPIYHQGHLANSESLDATVSMNSETFLMSNMSPQIPGLNVGAWKGLENRERKWATERGEVYVYAGALFIGGVKGVIGSNVPVPTHYYKIIYDPDTNEAVGYIFPNDAILTAQLRNLARSVDFIEIVSGLNFLDVLPDSLEEQIEGALLTTL